jgi:UDP:flavonoid glycosyltransferase YjiC (YdhE family)
MRFLFTSTRGAGHLQPLLPYARALRARGHEVAVAAPESVKAKLESAGLAHTLVDHAGDAALAPLWAHAQTLGPEEAARFFACEVFIGKSAAAALPKLLDAMRASRPDLVIRESAEFAGAVAADAAGVPHARVAVHLASSEEAIFGAAQIGSAVDALRERAGLSPDGGAWLSAEPIFAAFPAALEDPSIAPSGRAPFRARMPLSPAGSSAGSRWAAAADARPLVYVTFGTIAGGNPKTQEVFRAALEAVAGLPVRVLLTTGPAMDAGALGAVPSNVEVEAFVPQEEVLPHVAAVLCHGGSGTMLGALAHGVPLVAAPLGADQPFNGRQIARAGAGLTVDADARAMRAALERVLADAEIRRNAQRIAAEMAALPALDQAVDAMVALAGRSPSP